MEITVQWDPPRVQNRNGIIRSYKVLVTESGTGTVRQVSSTSHRAMVSGLKAFTSYRVQVAAYTVALGPYSTAEVVQTLQDSKLAFIY